VTFLPFNIFVKVTELIYASASFCVKWRQ
jgi:hypothetical protein